MFENENENPSFSSIWQYGWKMPWSEQRIPNFWILCILCVLFIQFAFTSDLPWAWKICAEIYVWTRAELNIHFSGIFSFHAQFWQLLQRTKDSRWQQWLHNGEISSNYSSLIFRVSWKLAKKNEFRFHFHFPTSSEMRKISPDREIKWSCM